MGRGGLQGDEMSVKKHLKVFAGGLPNSVSERHLGDHFARYGQIVAVNTVAPKEDGKAMFGFVTFKYAADADCAVVDPQHFSGVSRPLEMGFARKKGKDQANPAVADADACKVFVGGIGDRDSEEDVGDFFSQWGLVTLIYRDRDGWSFVHYATKEGAKRLLEETTVVYQRRRLDVKPSESKKVMGDDEKDDLVRRAIARHFHKKGQPALPPAGYYPPPGGYPPPAYPGYPPPQASYPPPQQGGYPPPAYPGYPPQPQQGGYPPPQPQGGYPPPAQQGGYPPPQQQGGYPPPQQQGGYPPPQQQGGYPPPAQQGGYAPPQGDPYGQPHQQAAPAQPPAAATDPYGRPLPALPAVPHGQPPPGADPRGGYGQPPPGGEAAPPAGAYVAQPPADPYARPPADPYARPPDGGYRPY